MRVSTVEQNTDRQLADIDAEKIFTDKASGKNTHRPQLEGMLNFIREGDTLVVHSMDRLARDLGDLRRIVKQLTDKGVRVEFIKEQLTFSGEDSPMAALLLNVMGAFAEFERALARERQREGIEVAKKRGVYKGRTPALTPEQTVELRTRAAAGEAKTVLARGFGISRATVYTYLNGH